MQTAAGVMTNSVVTVDPGMSLVEVFDLFVAEEIHGAPVVDADDTLLGVISSSDLLRATRDEHEKGSRKPDYLRDLVEFSGPDWGSDLMDFQDRLAQRIVSDVMTRSVATVAPTTPLSEVAGKMREHAIHRVWVEEEGRVCGVVSAFDLLGVIERATDSA